MPLDAASRRAYAAALEVIPGGVSSPVRAFGSVGGSPFFVERGEGAYLVDLDHNRYLDYVQSWGASILGHAHPVAVEAVRRAAGLGTSFGAPTLDEVRLAEAVVAAVPGVDQIRLVSSGTEAVMTAIRLARGATGRTRVVKFAGCYHGHSDALLAAAGSGVATLGLPASAGVPPEAVAQTLVAPFNTVPEIDERVACVVVEPVAANMGLVAPRPGFLEGLRRACDAAGALLVFDEVITGFRLGRDGATGRFGVRADLVCLGKVLGGGLPLAALGGRRELMGELAPDGAVYQAGTLSGNPLATAAGLATLALLDAPAYALLERRVGELAAGLSRAFEAAGLAASLPVVGTLLGIFFGEEEVGDYEAARRCAANGRYAQFFRAMLRRGVFLAPSPYEVVFTSLAHGDAEIEMTVEAAHLAALEVAARAETTEPGGAG